MRDSLTIFAIIVIAVLTAALAGPYLVDWTAQRGRIEAQLTDALGAETRIRGAIDLKLLPSPYFMVEDIALGAGGPDPRWSLTVKKMRLEVAAAALLHGDIDFVEARLEGPRLALNLGAAGGLPLSPPKDGVARRFRFQKIAIADGALRLDDAANRRSLDVAGIDFEAEAASLAGPFKARGRFGAGEARTAFRLATGPIENGGVKLKLSIDPRAAQPGASLDGRLGLNPDASAFQGAATFETAAEPLWRAAGQLTLDGSRATLDQIELRLGAEAQALRGAGQADLDFAAAPRASATLASDDIDLDAWRGASAGFAANLPALPSIPFTLTYRAKAARFGGAAFADIAVTLVAGPAPRDVGTHGEGSAWLRFEARGPGRSRLFFDGQWQPRPEPRLDGKAQASAQDLRWVKAWLTPLAPQWTPDALPFEAIDLSAQAQLTPRSIRLDALDAAIDGARVAGSFAYRPGDGSKRGRIDADLRTPVLNLSAFASDPRAMADRAFGASDGALRLQAQAITVGSSDSLGRLAVDVARAGEALQLKALAFDGLDGASIAASGAISQKTAHLDAKLAMRQGGRDIAGGGLFDAVGKAAPHPAADWLRARAGALAPLDLTVAVDAAEQNAAFAITALTAKGTIGPASIDARLEQDARQPATMALAASVKAKDSRPLLRLFGLASPTLGPQAAEFDIKARGPPGQTAQAEIRAALGPATFAFTGFLGTDLAQPSARGPFHLKSPDAAPLLRLLGFAAPGGARLPLAADGELAWTRSGLALDRLKADVAGTALAGALNFAPPRMTGSIGLDHLSSGTLFSLLLGAPQPAKAGALWSTLAFAPVPFELPDATVAVAVTDLALPDLFGRTPTGKDARFTLSTRPGLIEVQDLGFALGGGRIAGDLTVRRAAGDASLETRLDFADLALDGPALRARVTGAVDAAGSGNSADALAGSLAGGGRALLTDVVIPQADPAALPRVFSAFDQDGARLGTGDIAAALKRELKRGDLKAPNLGFDIAIAAGVLRLAPAAAGPGAALSAAYDIRQGQYLQRLTLTLDPPPKDMAGAPPQIALVHQGPPLSPVARIEAAALANALAARAILRESARIEAFEFDLHERAFFYRRLLSERRRAAEQAADEAQKAPQAAN